MNNLLSTVQTSESPVQCAEISSLKTLKKDWRKLKPGSRNIIKVKTQNALNAANKFISKCITVYSVTTLTFATLATKDGNTKNMIDFLWRPIKSPNGKFLPAEVHSTCPNLNSRSSTLKNFQKTPIKQKRKAK